MHFYIDGEARLAWIVCDKRDADISIDVGFSPNLQNLALVRIDQDRQPADFYTRALRIVSDNIDRLPGEIVDREGLNLVRSPRDGQGSRICAKVVTREQSNAEA
jgi:hypothetical protein